MKVVFIGCVKSKEDHRCEAQDMYISPLFEKSFAYAQQLNPDCIYILSAKYHLLPIDKVISPYDLTLNDMSADEKREWAEKVIKMCDAEGIKPTDHIIFLCGENYIGNLIEHFTNSEEPLKGLALGETMQWLDAHTDDKYKNKFSIITMSLINRLKLAKMLLKFGELKTDKGNLQYEGELEVGLDVFIEEDSNLIPAPDGEYKVEDITYIVENGKIKEIINPNEEEDKSSDDETETPIDADESNNDALDEANKKIEELEKKIEELENQLKEANDKLKMSVDKPAHVEIKENKLNKENKALKWFV